MKELINELEAKANLVAHLELNRYVEKKRKENHV